MATHTVTTGTAAKIYDPAAQTGRTVVTIVARSGGTHYLGQSTVTSSNGLPLAAGDRVVLHSPPAAVYAVNAQSGTLDITVTRS